MALGESERLLAALPDEAWSSFDRAVIERDLSEAVQKCGASVKIRDIAKPVVVCVFDEGMMGKSTLAHLYRQAKIPVFSTDGFVTHLRDDWHGQSEILELAHRLAPQSIDQFMRFVQASPALGADFVRLFFDPTHGFRHTEPLSVIEGMVYHPHFPALFRIDHKIRVELGVKGYKVWVSHACRRSMGK